MIKADIPQDVTEYKEQFFFGLTIRQFVCGIAMIALAVLTFFIRKSFISTDILMYIVIIEVAPLAAMGFMKYNGMPFEKFASTLFEFYAGKQRRGMTYLPEEVQIHDEVRKIWLNGLEKERAVEKKAKKRKKHKSKGGQ